MIKSLFCFKRESNNQLSCSHSQVSVLNQHKKHQEPKGGLVFFWFFFKIKSGLMRLQAGGSLLGPEKYESTPQRCRGPRTEAHSCIPYFSGLKSPIVCVLLPHSCSPPPQQHSTFPTLVWIRVSVPFLLPKSMPFGLFFFPLVTICS